MKIVLQITGLVIAIAALISLFSYLGDYEILTQYGKGHVWGKVLLLFIGLGIWYVGRRKAA